VRQKQDTKDTYGDKLRFSLTRRYSGQRGKNSQRAENGSHGNIKAEDGKGKGIAAERGNWGDFSSVFRQQLGPDWENRPENVDTTNRQRSSPAR